MAYPYKTIGASAAGVATILAVGTLLWWQRTTRPDMPRPQYEAAVMHAILECRAVWGDDTPFLQTIPANVSKIIVTNVWSNLVGSAWVDDPAHTGTMFSVYGYVTNSPATVWTNTVGLYPNATFQYPDAIRAVIEPVSGRALWEYGNVGYWKNCNIYPVMRWLETPGVWKGWIFPPTNYFNTHAPNELYALASKEYIPFNGIISPCPAYTTDAVPTNGERLSFLGGLAPTDWWTNFVTLNVGTSITQTNYWDGKVISWTNGVAYTNQYDTQETGQSVTRPGPLAGHRSTTNYTERFTYTPEYGNGLARNNASWQADFRFAFERQPQTYEFFYDPPPHTDKQYPWSTNAYNDMGRALSLLQWASEPVAWYPTGSVYDVIAIDPTGAATLSSRTVSSSTLNASVFPKIRVTGSASRDPNPPYAWSYTVNIDYSLGYYQIATNKYFARECVQMHYFGTILAGSPVSTWGLPTQLETPINTTPFTSTVYSLPPSNVPVTVEWLTVASLPDAAGYAAMTWPVPSSSWYFNAPNMSLMTYIPNVTERFVRSSITNYTNHAPAR